MINRRFLNVPRIFLSIYMYMYLNLNLKSSILPRLYRKHIMLSQKKNLQHQAAIELTKSVREFSESNQCFRDKSIQGHTNLQTLPLILAQSTSRLEWLCCFYTSSLSISLLSLPLQSKFLVYTAKHDLQLYAHRNSK